MAKNPAKSETLLERWWRVIYNNPVAVAIIIFCTITGAGFTYYKTIPESLQPNILSWVTGSKPSANNGWAYVANLAEKDDKTLTSPAKVEIIRQSPAADRQYYFREGDRVRITAPMPQIMIDFKYDGTKNVLKKPTHAKESISEEEDYTQRIFQVGAEYTVMDIDVYGKPGRDRVMYLRLVR